MKQNVILFIVVFVLFSCKKKEQEKIITPTKPDKILYSQYDSTFSVSSIRDMTGNYNMHCYTTEIPIPGDTNAFINLDIDSDKIDDFKVFVSNSLSGDNCGFCVYYNFYVSVSALSSNCSVCQERYTNRQAGYFNFNGVISNDSNWVSGVFLRMSSTCQRIGWGFKGSYIGFKKNNNYGWIKVASVGDNGVRILETGLNLTDSNKIMAGQTK